MTAPYHASLHAVVRIPQVDAASRAELLVFVRPKEEVVDALFVAARANDLAGLVAVLHPTSR